MADPSRQHWALNAYQDGNAITETTVHAPVPSPVILPEYCMSSKTVVIGRETVLDEMNRPTYDRRGYKIERYITGRVHICPSCGQTIIDKKGVPLAANDLQKRGDKSVAKVCRGVYLQMLPAEADKKSHGLQKIAIPRDLASLSGKLGTEVNHAGFRWKVVACASPLYNFTSHPYRWSPALIVQRKCRRLFKYLIIDEVHEQKSDESAQSMACSKLIAAVDHVLALTGTIIGGYANHLFPLLMRIAPKSLRDEGFVWGKDLPFSEAYGKIDRVVTIKEQDDSGGALRGNVKSMRRAKSGSREEKKYVRPGVMPTMFGRHMIGSCMFITLDEMSSELPDLFEYVGGPMPKQSAGMTDDDREHWEKVADGHIDTACDMGFRVGHR